MNRILYIAVIALLSTLLSASAREENQVKRFTRPFPIPTYELNAQLSDKVIDASSPPLSQMTVDGLWPDKKMLLVSFTSNPKDGYFILYRSVEMNDQAKWDERMKATGGPRCLQVAGGTAPVITAGTNAFINPC